MFISCNKFILVQEKTKKLNYKIKQQDLAIRHLQNQSPISSPSSSQSEASLFKVTNHIQPNFLSEDSETDHIEADIPGDPVSCTFNIYTAVGQDQH